MRVLGAIECGELHGAREPQTRLQGLSGADGVVDPVRAAQEPMRSEQRPMHRRLGAIADELDALKSSNEDDRAEEWLKFWSARDPDPTTERNAALEEHLRRVRYVMKAFSRLGPGWRSDRGRVYIRYGTPDRIERASDTRNQGEYEIWRYFGIGRVFVFYDMFGLGDYRLVQGSLF